MTKDEYIKTYNIAGKEVKLGIDDYGQCFFIEFLNDEGELEEVCLGTYNIDVIEDIYYVCDPVFQELKRKSFLDKLTDEEKTKLAEYDEIFAKENTRRV